MTIVPSPVPSLRYSTTEAAVTIDAVSKSTQQSWTLDEIEKQIRHKIEQKTSRSSGRTTM